jgi:hypothetical protein
MSSPNKRKSKSWQGKVNKETAPTPMENAVRTEITSCIVNSKVNVCPFTIRLAWHASGTYSKDDEIPGGSDGATMRFEPEISDGANAGLDMMMMILKPVKLKYPNLSYADLWTLAGVQAINLMGGPDVPFKFGRSDEDGGATCPMHGRLPDAALGAEHLREVFYRMGLDDQDIVALSGAHTVGSCHENRSGFDGPWTSRPTKFDNEYFVNLVNFTWKAREWEGPLQYTDVTGKLMMLPTDIALTKDPKFAKYVKLYAKDEKKFFDHFSIAFGKLIALGCPDNVQPGSVAEEVQEESIEDKDFRDMAMHGNLIRMKEIPGTPNPNSKEYFTDRTPMHKACYFGHDQVVSYLLECGADVNCVDVEGDTPLHDAASLGHIACVKLLLGAGAEKKVENKKKETPLDLAEALDYGDVKELLLVVERKKFLGMF